LPEGALPKGIQPRLGPDATALGQVFWYTLEGRDPDGNPTGGWDLQELRTIQDFYVRYALLSADGVSEVASVGGFVREYQVDVDPDAMRAHNVTLEQVIGAVKAANLDVGARTIEINKVEYVVRGIGFIKNLSDIENSVVRAADNVPIYVKDVAHVSLGPALRGGLLDKEGTEAVGGIVVVRFGANPLASINNVKKKIAEISPGLPRKTLPDGRVSQVTVVPYYDRTGLIYETLGTLNTALSEEILVTIIVILIMVLHLRSSIVISGVLPLAVLMAFIGMKLFKVDANIVALPGIAIAIGTIVDMGIIICENILRHLDEAGPQENRLEVVYRASSEVGSAVLTAVSTTVVSFLPVFTMTAAEGKLFKPLAYTKTFALISSVIIAITIVPALAHLFFVRRGKGRNLRNLLPGATIVLGVALAIWLKWWVGLVVILVGVWRLAEDRLPENYRRQAPLVSNYVAAFVVALVLSAEWLPLGPENGYILNAAFVVILVGGLMGLLQLFQGSYSRMLAWCLDHKAAFLSLPVTIVLSGGLVWLGFDSLFGWLPRPVRSSAPVAWLAHQFPGLGKEFMPPLDEGSYLWMPTTMPHASIGEAQDILRIQDMAIRQIPEVESVVGKLGRAESPLDPAPYSMIETVINYHPEFILDEHGRRKTFRFDENEMDNFRDRMGTPLPAPDGKSYLVRGKFARDGQGRLIPEPGGMPFRLWRSALDPALNEGRQAWAGIRNPDDIWDEIVEAGQVPGSTSAPRLQPIAARIVMLQSGMRAPMGIKIKGPDLPTIEKVSLEIERLLKEVPSVVPASVVADRIIGKPYLEIKIDRKAIARYGIPLADVQMV
ncbi:MAG TPA: efflux RND transporter permease subunit, partial [Candidatus Glassbacteria bacterium]|nr:efflux RND transporter permease subunit [Candidatus Glassbacteria bacterium]